MPTYEYKCSACGNEFEKFQPITSSPIRKCPKCGKSRVKRLIGSGAGLIFKGAGFYETDYRSDSYKTAAKNDGGAAPAKEGGESKPAAETSKPAAADAGSAPTPAPAKPAVQKSEPSSKRKSAK